MKPTLCTIVVLLSGNSNNLGVGGIIGICIATLAIVVILTLGALIVLRKRGVNINSHPNHMTFPDSTGFDNVLYQPGKEELSTGFNPQEAFS